MKQVKKVLSFALALILLVTACYTNGLGVSAGVNANGETETDVTRVYSGHNEEIVTFVLSECDYTKATQAVTATDSDYNFWNNITVYTTEKPEGMSLEKAHTNQKYYRMWDREKTLSIQLKQEIYNATTKIVIPAGTVFPSYAYDSGASATKGGYVTTQELEFIKPVNLVPEKFGPGTLWIKTIPATKAETIVKNIHVRDGKLLLFLSNKDYTDKGYKVATLDKIKEYDQLLDKIEIYTSDTDYTTLADARATDDAIHYNVWGENGSIAFDLESGWDATKISKVVVKAGCQFPSYEYTEKSAPVKTAYTVKADTTFIPKSNDSANCTAWTRKAAPVETPTGIAKMQIRTSDAKFLIFPTVSDYNNGINQVPLTLTEIKEYNLLDKIVLYQSDSNYATLNDLCKAEADNYYNIWQEYGSIALDLDNGWNGTTVKKIEFKAGCQFPSYGYTSGNQLDNVVYTLQEDLVYTTSTSSIENNSDWTLVDNPEDITVTGVKSGHNNHIVTFTLSNSDYTESGKNIGDNKTEYNFWNNIKLYTSDTDYVSLSDAHYDQKLFNMWGTPNTVSIQVGEKDDTTYSQLTKIEIPAGTVFPSQKYALGKSQKKGGFKTTETITFVKPEGATEGGSGYEWSVYEEQTDFDTTVTGIQVRGEANDKGYLFVILGNHDYSDVANNTDVVNNFGQYDILSKIELTTVEGITKPLSKVITSDAPTYNRYGVKGSIAFKLQDGWNGMTIKKVSIKKGAQFPSYRYTNGTATSKKTYILQEDITYATSSFDWANLNWSEYYEPVVNKTEIKNIHVRDGFVLLFLSNHDYAEVKATTPIGSKWSVYNLLDNITITKDGATNKLKNILPEDDAKKEAYYNIFGEIGAVGIKMREGYNGTTIQKVAIKKGAEFPAYVYTNGEAKAITSYVIEKDYVFNTGNTTAANNTVWTKVTPYSSETDVSGVTVADNKLTFTLTEHDYVAGEVGSNHTDFDYWNKVKVYTNDTTFDTLGTWADSATATYGPNTLSVTGTDDIVRVVIPAKTVFPSHKYTSGEIAECVGYYVAGEKVFEKQGGTWKDVSTGVSKVSGDVNGDGEVSSKDIVAMAKYAKNGYGYNASSLTYDAEKDEAGNRHIVRRVILGDVLHNYEKESDNLTYFSSSDIGLDSFLNDFYKRQVGYNDYVEGDMTVTSYKPGTTYSSIYNLPWLTKSLLWVDSKNSLESDRTAQLKKQIESIIVDRYGYVWNGDDAVEDPTLGIGKKHGMGWPFPNALHAGGGGSGDTLNVRSWEFNASDSVSKWTSSLSDESLSNGLYQGTASSTTSVTFTVEDYGSSPIIRKTSCAPWLTFELRMNGVTNPGNIDDIYVKWVNSDSNKEYTVKAGDIAAVNYGFTEDYEHVLYLPMYTQAEWNDKQIKKITIEIRAKDGTGAFGGTFALNYVRPSFDTRHSNNNANYIEAIKEYYNMTGDVDFVKANITKARKAMNFYLQMYNTTEKLNDQSYLYGHGGSRTTLETGLGNGYWDILYTPKYDFQSNMYFYQALKDLSYLEGVLSTNHINVDASAEIDTARPGQTGNSPYSEIASNLDAIANDVVGKMRTYFWNTKTERFMAGYDNSNPSNKVDYGYTTWNLQAIELGIATDEQAQSIMSWIDGTRAVAGSNEQTDLYKYEFAPRTATVNDKGIYGWLATNKLQENVYNLGYGNDVQFGGAVMYTSYYDLTSRIQVKDADDALGRLKGIQSWYNDVSAAYKSSGESVENFYLPYFTNKGVKMQNGTRGTGNGAVGIDGEFTESLLVAAAIPYGFFGMDSEGGNTLCVSPSLPSTMDHWKVENMQYNGVTYDLSIYKDAVRIDSVRGDATGLKVKVTLDCPEGKDIYVDGAKKAATKADGKATVTVDFADATIEVKEEEK